MCLWLDHIQVFWKITFINAMWIYDLVNFAHLVILPNFYAGLSKIYLTNTLNSYAKKKLKSGDPFRSYVRN